MEPWKLVSAPPTDSIAYDFAGGQYQLPASVGLAASSIDLFLLTNLNLAILIESLLLSLTGFTAREDGHGHMHR
jgi:hypothetical protein